MPDLEIPAGEPATLSVWFADKGDPVYEGDRLVELRMAGTTFDVPSPATGRLLKILAFPDDEVQPGQVLGWVDDETVDTSAPDPT